VDEPFNDDEALIVIAETENYAVLVGKDLDGEKVFNLELGPMTVHFFEEEWEELVGLIRSASRQ
jgi:hypothetical protein